MVSESRRGRCFSKKKNEYLEWKRERLRGHREPGHGGGSWGRGAGPGWDRGRSLRPGSCQTSADGGQLFTPLLPSPAARGSTPGWGGGGPDACDWPGQHLGRPAPPPPSCWEQLLLSPRTARRWVAWLGLRRCCWGRVGNGWRRSGSAIACSYWSKSQRPLATRAGTQSSQNRPGRGAAWLSKAERESSSR